MQKPSAEIKSVRPFNWVSKAEPDLEFKKWRRSFPKLVLEIGCGAGLHPIQWTGENPKRGMVAIERTQEKFKAFRQRMDHHDRHNLFAVKGDASDWVPQNLKKQEIDEVFLLYPNPYPKESQANKRWFRAPMMHLLIELLKPEGLIHFATNESFLFRESLEYGKDFWNLDVVETRFSDQTSWLPRTHFEKKYLARGEVCFDITFRKTHSKGTSSP